MGGGYVVDGCMAGGSQGCINSIGGGFEGGEGAVIPMGGAVRPLGGGSYPYGGGGQLSLLGGQLSLLGGGGS